MVATLEHMNDQIVLSFLLEAFLQRTHLQPAHWHRSAREISRWEYPVGAGVLHSGEMWHGPANAIKGEERRISKLNQHLAQIDVIKQHGVIYQEIQRA